MNILIVGGGIGGLTLAAALRQQGIEPRLIERTPAWAPVGAGIVLGMNAMRILTGLGLREALVDRGNCLAEAAITTNSGRVLSRADFGALEPELGPTVAIHRAALHEVLLTASEDGDIRLNTTLEKLNDTGSGVDVTFSDGVTESFDCVIGADGIGSQVRELVFGRVPVRYSGYTCWRFVVACPVDRNGTTEMWGRGRRFGIVPIDAERTYCFCTLNAPPGDPAAASISLDGFRGLYDEFDGEVPKILESIEDTSQLILNDLEEIHVSEWTRGRVALLGDAAHAMTPNMGQGAAMAIEDAHVLAEELAKAGDLPGALRAYDSRRRPRVEQIQSRSWNLGRVAQWQFPLAMALRNAMVGLTPDTVAVGAMRKMLAETI